MLTKQEFTQRSGIWTWSTASPSPGSARPPRYQGRRWLVRVTLSERRRLAMHPWQSRAVALEKCAEPVFKDREWRELYQAVMEPAGEVPGPGIPIIMRTTA